MLYLFQSHLPESPDFLRNQDFFHTFAHNNLLAVFSDPNRDPDGNSVCGQICGQGMTSRTEQTEIVTKIAGLRKIMEIFRGINQPIFSEQRVRWYKQRIAPAEHPQISAGATAFLVVLFGVFTIGVFPVFRRSQEGGVAVGADVLQRLLVFAVFVAGMVEK